MKLLCILLLALTFTFGATAQAQNILIRAATVHTMTKSGTLEDTDVLVSAGKIRKIGKNIKTPPHAASIIDAKGKQLTPGFFAGINSLGISEVPAVGESNDSSLSLAEMRPEFDVVPAYNPNSSLLPITRIEGYTFSLLGADAKGSIFSGQGRMVVLDGGYESFIGSSVLFINVGRDTSVLTGSSRAGQWMLLNQAVQEAEVPPSAADSALLTRTGRSTLARYMDSGTVVFDVDRASDILETLRFADRHGLKAVISGGAEAWMVAEQLAAAKVPVMLDPLSNLPGNFDLLGARLDNAAILEAAGVTLAVSGAGTHNARKQRQMAGNAVSYGLPHAAGIAALTSNPARIFGIEDQQGSIRRNKPANLVVWSGDPLEVTSVAEIVIINGEMIPMESRQTRLRDRYLPENPVMPRAYIKP